MTTDQGQEQNIGKKALIVRSSISCLAVSEIAKLSKFHNCYDNSLA